jgi:flagellar motor switch protein FliN/FliY
VEVKIELGRARVDRHDLSGLGIGSIVQLDTQVSDPVSVVVNGGVVARGEILVIENKLCVRVAELVSDSSRVTHEAA